ncbi:hypothetical protein [Priestia aryabhattai]
MTRKLTKQAQKRLRKDLYLNGYLIFAGVSLTIAILTNFSTFSLLFFIPILIMGWKLRKKYKRERYILEKGEIQEAYLQTYKPTGLTVNGIQQYEISFNIFYDSKNILVTDTTFERERIQEQYEHKLFYSPKYPNKCVVPEFRGLTEADTFKSTQSGLHKENNKGTVHSSNNKEQHSSKDSSSDSPFF